MAQRGDESIAVSESEVLEIPEESTREKNDISLADREENPNTAEEPLQPQQSISKNQQKKLKRKQEWEAGRESRKARKKEKAKAKKEHDRATGTVRPRRKHVKSKQVPISLVIDCQFDELMTDNERVSLASQITRCYSDNRNSPFRTHLAVSSFSGKLKERFDTVLHANHKTWENIRFRESDFVAVAEESSQWMSGSKGSSLVGAFKQDADISDSIETGKNLEGNREVIYLTSESPNTLTELQPYSTYIIGGLVDKNRHKGICYKRAMDRGIKTAKLPIGEHLKMQSRFVLATNHVCEIMLKWLVLGDWTQALMDVMPKRKGGDVKPSFFPQQTSCAGEVPPQEDEGESSDGEARCEHEEAANDSSLGNDVQKGPAD
ncbi:MAG: tRNA (guanine(9)-N(1))-methyltransferase [Alyxoria varia]|nr:MAG: tRNA (guanine(9)-N(1))-methyltransferase [Alyxoria varia]